MDLSEINKIALLDNKPTKKLHELARDTPFKILNAKLIKTQFGSSILLELDEYMVFFTKTNNVKS